VGVIGDCEYAPPELESRIPSVAPAPAAPAATRSNGSGQWRRLRPGRGRARAYGAAMDAALPAIRVYLWQRALTGVDRWDHVRERLGMPSVLAQTPRCRLLVPRGLHW